MTTRIGYIRQVVQDNGGIVSHHYANGPGNPRCGTMGGFSPNGPNAGKVLYKIVTDFLTEDAKFKILVTLTMFGAHLGIERSYLCKNGFIKVVFSETVR